MSSVSQTSPKRRLGFAAWFAVSLLAIAAILGVALGPFWGAIFRAVGRARPHAPDMTLWGGLPLAIKLHVLSAAGALALGAVLMTVRKGRLFHRAAGWAWVCLVSLVAGSSIFITGLNHGRFSLLHLFTAWTLIVLPLAVIWARRHWVARHRGAMMGLFYGGFVIGGVIAFLPGRTMWTMMFG